jgi:hypothetical protein
MSAGLGILWWWSLFKVVFVVILSLVVALSSGPQAAFLAAVQFYLLMASFVGSNIFGF